MKTYSIEHEAVESGMQELNKAILDLTLSSASIESDPDKSKQRIHEAIERAAGVYMIFEELLLTPDNDPITT